MAANLACDKFWVDKSVYHDAERKYNENKSKLRKNEEYDKRSQEFNKKSKEIKNNKFQMKKNENDLTIINSNQNEKNKGNEHKTEKDDHFDKKGKQKEIKEKKNKSEKKFKKNQEKEEGKVGGVGMANVSQETYPKSWLAGEVAKARQHIKSSLASMGDFPSNKVSDEGFRKIHEVLDKIQNSIESLEKRVAVLEKKCVACPQPCDTKASQSQTTNKEASVKKEEEDVDLFGSESEEEDEEAKKIKEQRLAEYAAKKSKKPALIAKSNIILDVKPWDDETDMKLMEKEVRTIEMDGLIWGASKLVPLAYGIHKLQISCVVEDDKVSVDLLTEKIEEIQDYVQSVDIAAFNKV